MDVATLLGYTLGLGLILWSMSHGGGLSALKLFVHPPAAAVVCGGSFAAILIHFPLSDVKGLIKIILKNFINKIPEPTQEIDRIIEYANLARKEGLLALEGKLKDVSDPFFAKGIQLVIDGFSAQTVRDALRALMARPTHKTPDARDPELFVIPIMPPRASIPRRTPRSA